LRLSLKQGDGSSLLAVGPRAAAPRFKGYHEGPVDLRGAETVAVARGVVRDPYYKGSVTDLEVSLAPPDAAPPREGRWVEVSGALSDTGICLHPAERFVLRRFAQDGTSRLQQAASPALWGAIEGLDGDQVFADTWVVPLRSPTLPPARHTNMVVLAGAGLVVDPGATTNKERTRALTLLRAVRAASGGLQAIFCTHHHLDHLAAARWLAERLDLPLWGHRRTAALMSGRGDLQRTFEDGEEIPHHKGGTSGWVTLLTPGHAPGHLCLWHEGTRRLVAGDMVAAEGTVVVDPEDGDMAVYIESLRRLASLDAAALVPGHGPVLVPAEPVLRYYIAHRLEREQKVIDALITDAVPLDQVLAAAYDDVPKVLLPLASRSLESHLRKLEAEGRISRRGSLVCRRAELP